MKIGNNILDVKNHNRQALLQCLLDSAQSRVELAQRLGLTSMTVSNLVRTLLAEGWLAEIAPPANRRAVGRPRKQLQIKQDARYAVGVHIGIGTYRVALVDLVGTVLRFEDATFPLVQSAQQTLTQFGQAARRLIAAHSLSNVQLLGIGVGASGLVESVAGVNVIAPSLAWRNVPIAALLHQQTELPIFVENNVRAMALAEAYFGRGRAVDSLAFVFGRIGIGAGFVMQRKLFRGTAAGAGEIGHTIIMPENGQRCRCGQTGCLETLVTESALLGNERTQTVVQLLDQARSGNRAAIGKIERLSRYLGIALINLVNTLNPERIVLGGLYAQSADLLLPRLRQFVSRQAFGGLGDLVTIDTATFGENAGVLGAASLALINNFYARPRHSNIRSTTM